MDERIRTGNHAVPRPLDSDGRDRHGVPAFRRRGGRPMRPRAPLPRGRAVLVGTSVWVAFFALWELAAFAGLVSDLLLPPPHEVATALAALLTERDFVWDIAVSVARIVASFAIACAVAIPLGLAMGVSPTARAAMNPFVSAWRYLPAPAFIPVLLMWFGTGEAPKIALLFLGVVFFLVTLVMDHTRNVRVALIETAMTLGATRATIVRTVVVPAVLPNIVDTMRQMLAISWTYLVVAEVVAANSGIGAMMMRARRFLNTDEILAGIIVIGALGLLFDATFRLIHRLAFPYLREKKA